MKNIFRMNDMPAWMIIPMALVAQIKTWLFLGKRRYQYCGAYTTWEPAPPDYKCNWDWPGAKKGMVEKYHPCNDECFNCWGF